MRVDKPQFHDGYSYLNGCLHCPFTDSEGYLFDGKFEKLCLNWSTTGECPNTPEEYAEACALADAAAKEGE